MPKRIMLVGLALATALAAGAARAEDSGFATKSITNLGLTGSAPSATGNGNGENGRSPPAVAPAPQVRNGGSFGVPATGAVGNGPGVPAPGGGSFAGPAAR